MKETILWALFTMVSSTLLGATELSEREYRQIHSSNQRLSIQLAQKRAMRRLAKIDEASAQKMAEKVCGEDVETIRLKHRNRKLYYEIRTEGCHLHINALDGKILHKARR